MTRPQFGFQKNQGAFLPWLEGADAAKAAGAGVPAPGALHFPVMLYYPEASPYHDTIEDVCETDTIRDHLEAVRRARCCHDTCMCVMHYVTHMHVCEALRPVFPVSVLRRGVWQGLHETGPAVSICDEIAFAYLVRFAVPGMWPNIVRSCGVCYSVRGKQACGFHSNVRILPSGACSSPRCHVSKVSAATCRQCVAPLLHSTAQHRLSSAASCVPHCRTACW